MVFIKGAWIQLWPGDDKFYEYFCCPNGHLNQTAHIETWDASTIPPTGEKHDPPCWVTFHCSKESMKEIPHDILKDRQFEIIRPPWCPLRESSKM